MDGIPRRLCYQHCFHLRKKGVRAMFRQTITTIGLGFVLTYATLPVAAAAAVADQATQEQFTEQFLEVNPGVATDIRKGRLTRVYGQAFSRGASARDSANAFVRAHSRMFGVEADELALGGRWAPGGKETVPMMYNPDTGDYKFTAVYYSQLRDNVPVFRSRLILLTRNEKGFPLVHASADLRNLGNFQVSHKSVIADERAYRSALNVAAGLDSFTDIEPVVWAGVDDMIVEPRLAVQFIAEAGDTSDPNTYQKWLFLVDAQTGELLHKENQIHNVDINGNTSGMATQGKGADICEPEAAEALPHVLVNSFFRFTLANEGGAYALPVFFGGFPRPVHARLFGLDFKVDNEAGLNTVLTETVVPPGPANFLFNAANTDEFQRAEVNAYVEAHVVRDFILAANPTYPVISGQRFFDINVNINDSCNAFYNGVSINFIRAGDGCPNTANTTIVHHEYGHHLVNSGGSGQGAYGEGMGDVVGLLLTDDPVLAYGFFGNCSTGLRNADNNIQFPCFGEIHFCGQLLSGSVWETRNELVITEPNDYIAILRDLAVNSVLLHTGTSITRQIATDWLTLDDDDGNIFNGTPHCNEIQTGFGEHSMAAPDVICP
jgi:hypothetical protein